MLASALFRMSRPPYVMGGIAMLWGYLRSMLQRKPRYPEPGFAQFLRTYQWNCLWRGKRKATDTLNRRQAEVWEKLHSPSAPSPAAARQ
jgi:hypothetical protein